MKRADHKRLANLDIDDVRMHVEDALLPPISIVLPAYNEEMGIGPQIESIRQVLTSHGLTHEIIVVDDGSVDQTGERALQARARVLRHFENRGYGAALKTGIEASKYETIVIADADGTYPAQDIPLLISKIGDADMVVGARVGTQVHIPIRRRPAKWLLGWFAGYIGGQRIPDLNSGMRIFRRDCVKQYFSILPDGFSFTTTVTLAFLADGYRVIYHPINYNRRIGNSKIMPRHFMDFMILVLRMAMLFQPLKVFVPLALLCGLLGVSKTLFDLMLLSPELFSLDWAALLTHPLLSTSSVLLLLVGLQLMLIGMVADALLRKIARNNTSLAPSHAIYAHATRLKKGMMLRSEVDVDELENRDVLVPDV